MQTINDWKRFNCLVSGKFKIATMATSAEAAIRQVAIFEGVPSRWVEVVSETEFMVAA